MKATITFLAGLVFATVLAHAQWTPVTARIRVTTITSAASAAPETTVREGNYFRSSDGSVLRQWEKRVAGSSTIVNGDLVDFNNSVAYSLDYVGHRAVVKRRNLPHSSQDVFVSGLNSIAEDRIDSLPCTIIKSTIQTIAGRRIDSGTACVSREFGLILRTDDTVQVSSGATIRTITEMHQVRIGNVPNADLFDVGHNFTIVTTEASR